MLAIYLHRKITQLTLAEICSIFSLNSHAAVSNAITRFEKQMQADQTLKSDVNAICNRINYPMERLNGNKCHVNT